MLKKVIGYGLVGLAASKSSITGPMGFKSQEDFDFPVTKAEEAGGWSLENRCGQEAIAGSDKDQRKDTNCPNVILINTDDMSWADISINNPSKYIPTPNIDRLVSKETFYQIDYVRCFWSRRRSFSRYRIPHLAYLTSRNFRLET